MKILVTGAAGFIGFSSCLRLLKRGDIVVGIDNLNNYYDVSLKHSRLELLQEHPCFTFIHADIADCGAMDDAFTTMHPDRVLHLAAQAGVGYSLTNPQAYVEANLKGHLNILECCRRLRIEHLVYASSSSVYGANTQLPFSVRHNTDHPVSLYAATKKSNEVISHSYSDLFNLPTTGLRFFTVYGPWGRPDMALFIFTRNMLANKPIDVFNHGMHKRDFTYIDDIVDGVIASLDRPPLPDPSWSGDSPSPNSSRAPYRIYNLGNHNSVPLLRYIEVLESALGVKARLNMRPLQAGDVPCTYADITEAQFDLGYTPKTSIETGINAFVAWYRSYYEALI